MPTALTILAAAALATNAATFNDGRPPERFTQGATVSVEFRDQAGIDVECQALFGQPPAGAKTNACFTGRKVIMPNPCSFPKTDTYAHLLCHELGHVNGWTAAHQK